MSNVVTHKKKKAEIVSMIAGIAVIVVFTIIVYAVGYAFSQSANFAPKTRYRKIINDYSGRYYVSMFSSLIQVIVYVVMFKVIASRSETEYYCIPMATGSSSGKSKYIYSGWLIAGIISTVCVGGIALVLHYFGFSKHTDLIGPLMWWVILLQMLVSLSVYFIPLTKPLKKFGT